MVKHLNKDNEPWVQNKFEKQEKICIGKFHVLTGLPIMTAYFVVTASTEYGACADFIALNLTGGTVIVEWKHREADALKYADVFIEVHKYDDLMDLSDRGCLVLYVNTFEGCDDFYIWVLELIPEESLKLYKNVKIKSDIIGYKHGDRYGLKWKDAWIFGSDGTIKQRPSYAGRKPRKPIRHEQLDLNKKITNKILKSL